jgi:hypothetical protein
MAFQAPFRPRRLLGALGGGPSPGSPPCSAHESRSIDSAARLITLSPERHRPHLCCAMATQPTKLQRWLDVIAYLAGRRLPVTVEQLWEAVPAYEAGLEGDEKAKQTVRRMFERDKDELRGLGIPIETVPFSIHYGREQTVGYRLGAKDFHLPYLRLVAKRAVGRQGRIRRGRPVARTRRAPPPARARATSLSRRPRRAPRWRGSASSPRSRPSRSGPPHARRSGSWRSTSIRISRGRRPSSTPRTPRRPRAAIRSGSSPAPSSGARPCASTTGA